MNKNPMSIYLTVILILFFNFSGHTQTWKPQTWSNSCWAAATENVFSQMFTDTTKNVGECKLVKYRDSRNITWCDTGASRYVANFLVGSKPEYMNIIKGYASFYYLKNGNQTLAWDTLLRIRRKPIIFSIDSDNLNMNHFVNIYHAKVLGALRWLYVFDPLPTKIGTHYLKNYLSYQLPTQNPRRDSLQTTYYNFGKRTYVTAAGKTRYKATIQNGVPSDSNIYIRYDPTVIVTQFSRVFNAVKRLPPARKITGLAQTMRLDSIVMGLPAIAVTNFRRSTSRTDSLSVLVSESRSQIVPIFKDSSGRLKSVSLMILLRKSATTADSNLVVWDRIQRLNLPDSVITEINLPAATETETVNGVRVIKIPKGLIEFIDTENGGLYLKKGGEYYNILEQNPRWLRQDDFYREISQVSLLYQPTIFDRTAINSNSGQFLTILREKGLEVQVQNGVDVVKWNNVFIKATDLQQQLQAAPVNQNSKQIILFDKEIDTRLLGCSFSLSPQAISLADGFFFAPIISPILGIFCVEKALDLCGVPNKHLLNAPCNMKQYLPVRGHTEWRYVCTDCIVRIEADRNYSRIVLNDGSVLLAAKTLKTFDGCLPSCFVRIHKSCLLNVHFVAKIATLKTILLTDGTQLTLARRKATFFKKRFRNGLFDLVA